MKARRLTLLRATVCLLSFLLLALVTARRTASTLLAFGTLLLAGAALSISAVIVHACFTALRSRHAFSISGYTARVATNANHATRAVMATILIGRREKVSN